ncbi:RNA-binding S4 domain-containing protein [Salibacteraceae bacterium]|nr:RNA-binding S4 domain-containing protein [Salibacteraceae bacterium]
MRIDKYLWHVRLTKTRSIASKNCTSEKVKLNGLNAKPSKEINLNDQISIRDNPTWRTFKVLDIPKNRVGAKLVGTYLLETTSEDDLGKIKMIQEMNRQNKFHGIVGRPTKRDRRDLDRFKTDE